MQYEAQDSGAIAGNRKEQLVAECGRFVPLCEGRRVALAVALGRQCIGGTAAQHSNSGFVSTSSTGESKPSSMAPGKPMS